MTEQQNSVEPQELDRKDLKIMAYKEKLTEVEDQNAELRVNVTMLSQQLQQVWNQLQELQAKEGADVPQEVPTDDSGD